MMYSFDYLFLLIMFMTGLLIFCSMYKHLLITLLSLEYMVLCVYMLMLYFLVGYIGEMYMLMMFLTFSVCEGVLGLSVLVGLIRSHGNDLVNSLFTMW